MSPSVRALSKGIRVVICFALLTAATPAVAQRGNAQLPGMPDMSTAPADVQAIMKKVMGGGIPTQDEARKLSDWMQANKSNIARSATAHGDSMKQRAAVLRTSVLGRNDQPSCPTKVTLPASLAVAPTDAGASALLDTIKRTSLAKLDAKSARLLQSSLDQLTNPGEINQVAAFLFLKGQVDAALVAYVSEVLRTPSASADVAWGDLGAALASTGDGIHAVRATRRSLGLGYRSAWKVTNLGVAYADLGDLSTAATMLQEATRIDPKYAGAYDALAHVSSCAGNTTMAMAAAQQAQDDDWDPERQQQIDRREKNEQKSNNSDDSDDRVEATRPLPHPPGPPLNPPPTHAGGQPGAFEAAQPKLGDTYQESKAYAQFNMMSMTQYQEIARAVGQEPNPAARTADPSASSHGVSVMIRLSNGDAALKGAELVRSIIAARSNVAFADYQQKHIAIMNQAQAAFAAALRPLDHCDSKKQDCTEAMCRALRPVAATYYAQQRAAAADLLGELANFARFLNIMMNQWFDWAEDPGARHAIDVQRRNMLATLQVEGFSAASTVHAGAAAPEECDHPPPPKRGRSAKGDDANEAGACDKRSIKLPFFASMQADCHKMTMSIDFPPITALFGGLSPTMDIERANGAHNGHFIIGVGKDVVVGKGVAGVGVTWDQAGWVRGAGPTISSQAGIDATGRASMNLMVNGVQGGDRVQGSVDISSGMHPAPSTNFGGR